MRECSIFGTILLWLRDSRQNTLRNLIFSAHFRVFFPVYFRLVNYILRSFPIVLSHCYFPVFLLIIICVFVCHNPLRNVSTFIEICFIPRELKLNWATEWAQGKYENRINVLIWPWDWVYLKQCCNGQLNLMN